MVSPGDVEYVQWETNPNDSTTHLDQLLQKQDALSQCWAMVANGGPILNHHFTNVLYFQGGGGVYIIRRWTDIKPPSGQRVVMFEGLRLDGDGIGQHAE